MVCARSQLIPSFRRRMLDGKHLDQDYGAPSSTRLRAGYFSKSDEKDGGADALPTSNAGANSKHGKGAEALPELCQRGCGTCPVVGGGAAPPWDRGVDGRRAEARWTLQ